MSGVDGSYMRGYRAAIVAMLGGKCQVCPVHDPRVLQIDHVVGGGNRHRREVASGTAYLRSIARALSTKEGRRRFRLLCANHNALAAVSRRRST